MAIDTAADRRSVAGMFPVGWGITPDAAKGGAWRRQVAWNYSGLEVPMVSVDPSYTGTMDSGEVLTGTEGTWTGSATITITHQWQKADPVYDMGALVYDGAAIPNNIVTDSYSNIPGATSLNYTLTISDIGFMIRRQETATNSEGSGIAYTTQDGPVEVGAGGGAVPGGALTGALMGAFAGSLAGAFAGDWDEEDD